MIPLQLIKIWVHVDGRRIEVYENAKVRYSGRPHARSEVRIGDVGDEWPVLYRSTVPALTDVEWYARPDGDGWTEVQS